MDWNKPTTKKHIREAEAHGCKLIGPGRDFKYRLYELPCGHEQEARTEFMRRGVFECKTCVFEKLKAEAEAQGCKLLGPGTSVLSRLYELPCGHKQEVGLRHMRDGGFRCRICLAKKLEEEATTQGCKLVGPGKDLESKLYVLPCGHEQEIKIANMRNESYRCSVCLTQKLEQEAEARGCKLLGAGKNSQYRLYSLPCGHEQEVQPGMLRKGHFGCKTCLAERLNQEATAQGCKLVGPGKNFYYRLYILPCGHEQELRPDHMREGNIRCAICMAEKLKQEAEAQGCKLLGAGKNFYCRLYLLPCGHEQEVGTGAMRSGGFRCSTCLAEKLEQEATAQGCRLIGKGRNTNYRKYELSCGHEQEVDVGAMRNGSFLCQICEETSRTLPSNLYLLYIQVDSDQWLKLGYAKSVDNRVTRYGLPNAATVTVIDSVPFDTGNEAHAIEADIHKRYRRKRLTQKQMRDFHTRGGFNECYPVTMLETLRAELEAVKQAQAS